MGKTTATVLCCSFCAFCTLLLACPAAAGEPAGLAPELSRKAAELWGKHFVTVEVWLQRSEGEDPSRSRFLTNEYEEKRPLEVAGLAVDPRAVWMPDIVLERRFIARVAVRAGAGKDPLRAVLHGTFLKTPGWVVRTEEPIPGIEPLAFVPAEGGPAGLLTIGAAFARGERVLTITRAGGEYWRSAEGFWTQVQVGVLILDRQLRPVGYSASGLVGLESAPDIWRGGEIAAGPILEFAAFDRMKEIISRETAPWVLTVRGFFRREEDLESRRSRRFRYRYSGDEGEVRNDFLAPGYSVGPSRVLVNFPLTQETAMKLERVVVMAGGEERKARFLGAFRDYRAFLAEIEGAPLQGPLDLSSDARFALSQPVITLTADHETGRRREIVELNRVIDFGRAYKGVIEPSIQRFPRPATIFLDVESHAFLGAVLEVNRESEEDDASRSFRSRGMIDLRVLRPAEIRDLLAKGEAAFDPRLRPRPAEREKDMVWLGVDFQPLTRDLAKSHGVEIPTRGGEIGLIVLVVHPKSPAAQAGLEPGDILLSAQEEGEPEPFEFKAGSGYGREEMLSEMLSMGEDIPEEIQEEYLLSAGPPWRSPRNFLNEKFTRIGEGRKLEVVYLRGGAQRRAGITLTLAPPDFESARKFKAEDLGLTVKDLTYEVRNYYRLKDDAPGVVIAKVEPGSKAAVAKVLPYEILVSANGKVMRDIDEFRRILEEAGRAEAPERMLELKLERMGKSRLVRIRM